MYVTTEIVNDSLDVHHLQVTLINDDFSIKIDGKSYHLPISLLELKIGKHRTKINQKN